MKAKPLLLVYVGLIGLLALTIGLAFFPGTTFVKPLAGLMIAVLKAALVAAFFMDLRGSSGLVRVVAVAGAFWLLLLFLLTGADYVTRSW